MNEIKKDCFAWSEKRWQCDVLDEIVCKRKNCSFFMAKEEYQAKQKDAELKQIELVRDKALKRKNEMAKTFQHNDRIWRFIEL